MFQSSGISPCARTLSSPWYLGSLADLTAPVDPPRPWRKGKAGCQTSLPLGHCLRSVLRTHPWPCNSPAPQTEARTCPSPFLRGCSRVSTCGVTTCMMEGRVVKGECPEPLPPSAMTSPGLKSTLCQPSLSGLLWLLDKKETALVGG